MSKIRTGETVYENIISVDADNNPITGATFNTILFKNGSEYTASTVSISLSDASYGIYTASWSSDTVGSYQLLVNNDTTGVIFLSDPVLIKPDSEFNTTIYLGF